uniref:Uncharacterized protein n=1 Tax=Leptobrachium leishanense TaxID=445787 RepID=A0A8C5QK60_9ANUR
FIPEELNCSVCLNIFSDPVMLSCGHNFCRVCIGNVLDTQGRSGLYTCPECRAEFTERPGAQPICPDRKCSVHKRFLEYYCSEDAVCICVSCRLDGEHRGHHVDTLSEASEKKKEKLTHVLEELTSKRRETQKKVQSLGDRSREAHNKAAEVTERIKALFRDIRTQLDFLEKRVLVEVSWQNVQALLSVSDLILQLESQRDELSKKMRHVEELRNFADPLTFLRGPDAEDSAAKSEKGDEQERDVKDLDEVQIMWTLRSSIADILTKINRGDSGGDPATCPKAGHVRPSSDLKMPPGHR